jgi:hypothetical protein
MVWWLPSSGDSLITVAGRSKAASASRSGSARSVPSPYARCRVSFPPRCPFSSVRLANAVSEKWGFAERAGPEADGDLY